MRRPANHIRIKYEEYQDYVTRIPALRTKPVSIAVDEWAYSGGRPNSYKVAPAYAWAFHEMFRHSDLYQMACFTFATSLISSKSGEATLNPAGLVFKLYREHFGEIPVEVSGNSPQPNPKYPPGGEEPHVNAGSDTFPVDVAAAWSADRKSLIVAVINPTTSLQEIDLAIDGAALSAGGKMWRMARLTSTRPSSSGRNRVSKSRSKPCAAVPSSLTLPPWSVSIYEFRVK